MNYKEQIDEHINNLVKAVEVIFFQVEGEGVDLSKFSDKQKKFYDELLTMVEAQRMKEAQNTLNDRITQSKAEEVDDLRVGLAFYDVLNDKTDAELEKGGLNRDQIRIGVVELTRMFHLQEIFDLLIQEELASQEKEGLKGPTTLH